MEIARLGSTNASAFEGGSVQDNELKFNQLKQLYTDVVNCNDLLQQIDAAVTSQLLTKCKSLPWSTGGSDGESDIDQSEKPSYNPFPVGLSQLSDEESEADSMASMVDRADAPTTTQGLFSTIADAVGGAVSAVGDVVGDVATGVYDAAGTVVQGVGSAVKTAAKVADAVTGAMSGYVEGAVTGAVTGLVQGAIEGYNGSPTVDEAAPVETETKPGKRMIYVPGPQQTHYSSFPPNMMPQNYFQQPGGNPYAAVLQHLYQQYIAPHFSPFVPQMPPQYSFGQGAPAMYPQGSYHPQIPQGYGVPAGYVQSHYQPRYPSGYGVPAGYVQSHYQPRYPPGYGVPAGYSQGSYGPQSYPSYPQSYYQQQYLPQPYGHYPRTTRSANRGFSPSATRSSSPSSTRSQSGGPDSCSPSPSSNPDCSPVLTVAVPGYSPSENYTTDFITPPDMQISKQQNKSSAFDNIEFEVIKYIKHIDNKINDIINKLES